MGIKKNESNKLEKILDYCIKHNIQAMFEMNNWDNCMCDTRCLSDEGIQLVIKQSLFDFNNGCRMFQRR